MQNTQLSKVAQSSMFPNNLFVNYNMSFAVLPVEPFMAGELPKLMEEKGIKITISGEFTNMIFSKLKDKEIFSEPSKLIKTKLLRRKDSTDTNIRKDFKENLSIPTKSFLAQFVGIIKMGPQFGILDLGLNIFHINLSDIDLGGIVSLRLKKKSEFEYEIEIVTLNYGYPYEGGNFFWPVK